MKKFISIFLMILSFTVISGKAALADEATPLGKFGDWTAYVFTEDGNTVCYMASEPIKAEGNYTKRGDVYALVTHRPAEGTKNVFSYITGYTYKPGSDVTVTANSNKYVLFTQEDTAWLPDAVSDNRLSDDIKKGSRMIVKGMSSRGTKTTDTFSLKGSSSAYDAISKRCGV